MFTRPIGNRHSFSHAVDHELFDMVDHVPSNIPSHLLDDNEAVIRRITKKTKLKLEARFSEYWTSSENQFGPFNSNQICAHDRTTG